MLSKKFNFSPLLKIYIIYILFFSNKEFFSTENKIRLYNLGFNIDTYNYSVVKCLSMVNCVFYS